MPSIATSDPQLRAAADHLRAGLALLNGTRLEPDDLDALLDEVRSGLCAIERVTEERPPDSDPHLP